MKTNVIQLNETNVRQQVIESQCITPFQRKVYLALLQVPRGTTITYRQLAQRIGCRSAQAVGQALKHNPFAPYVPCHRVIATDGTLGGYHGQTQGPSIERKLQLLRDEGIEIAPPVLAHSIPTGPATPKNQPPENAKKTN